MFKNQIRRKQKNNIFNFKLSNLNEKKIILNQIKFAAIYSNIFKIQFKMDNLNKIYQNNFSHSYKKKSNYK